MVRNKHPEETINLILDVSLNLFMEKGYDNTTIQDIINGLGGLSKGAIYHHFKSKDEIYAAVMGMIEKRSTQHYDSILHNSSLNGIGKLQAMLESSYSNPNTLAFFKMCSSQLQDPKFLYAQIVSNYQVASPLYLQPVIEEGIRDGSIQTDYPKELAEVILTLMNVWISPITSKSSIEEIERKMYFFKHILDSLGIIIIDKDMIDKTIKHIKSYF
ncbi:TetR/AcrR family transcriptional regulator [Clostridium sp.]|uniref:TetR/AcrR family transcriptional regulator n=1 Tax=Clostridium sp. TaxID=1506 RepID=UPI002FCBB47A